MEWTATGSAGGTAELPSGHRRLVKLNGTTRATEDYYVTPATIGSTDGAWRAIIYAPNGSHIYADGLRGFPTIGTPTVRLQQDAPAKAVLTIPASRSGGILAPGFAGWSDGHTEPARRGMELTVEYRRNDGTMALVFRGMIYQVQSGDMITITAYDRLMDLYQFSDQYQSHQGFRERTLALSATTADNYVYTAPEAPGAIITASVKSDIQIDALASATVEDIDNSNTNYTLVSLPSSGGASPNAGDTIKRIQFKVQVDHIGEVSPVPMTIRAALFHIVNNTVTRVTDWIDKTILFYQTGTQIWSADVSWTIPSPASEYFIGFTRDRYNGYALRYLLGSSSPQTVQTFLHTTKFVTLLEPSTALSDWQSGPLWEGSYPEPAVYFEHIDQIAPGQIGLSGNNINIPKTAVTTPSSGYATTPRPAYELATSYQIYGGTDIYTVVHDLIDAAGLVADIPAGALLGQTTFYTSSTYDYLTCVQELIKGGNYGARASIEEPGRIIIRPHHTIDDTPAASFSTAPGGSAEHAIVSHNITAHWMAEKATQAIIAEDATSSGLPLAIETDDALMDGSLCRELQSPLRGITADSSMGTHLLLATAAGGKMVQLHTNIYEGEITLAGYRSEIWNLAGDHAGGKPISIEVPEYGAQGTAVPTAVEFGGGVTRVSLDNIRTADRSEVARSMGLTGDAISNTARTLPNTAYVFARYDDYTTQETGLAPGSVTAVEFIADGGTVLASQTDTNFIKTAEDAAGYLHICTVLPAITAGYAASTPIAAVRFTMGGTARTAVLDNPKYSLGGQALHADIRLRKI